MASPGVGNRCVCMALRWCAKNGVTRQKQREKRSSVTCHRRLSRGKKTDSPKVPTPQPNPLVVVK